MYLNEKEKIKALGEITNLATRLKGKRREISDVSYAICNAYDISCHPCASQEQIVQTLCNVLQDRGVKCKTTIAINGIQIVPITSALYNYRILVNKYATGITIFYFQD